jgi:hypothetical protein
MRVLSPIALASSVEGGRSYNDVLCVCVVGDVVIIQYTYRVKEVAGQ